MKIAHSTALGLVACVLALPPAFGEPAAQVQTRCFNIAGQPARLVQLRLIDTEDDNEAAFVRYTGARAWIPLVLSSSKDVALADSGRSQLDEEWLEVVHGRISGRYLLSMLGAEVVSFSYLDGKSGKKTDFALAPTPRGVDPCEQVFK